MTSPSADVSVRLAWDADADAIAHLQVRAWASRYASTLPPEALPSDPAPIAEQWRSALAKPGDARNRVLVALERNRVTGFVVASPAGDPDCDPIVDGEMSELTISPDELGQGHGSRLLQAAADTLAADRFTRAVSWVTTGDDELRAFLTSAGWAPDGAHRELDLDGSGAVRVKQTRLHTALA